ncbi:hypothetical protein Q1W73_07250 [Asticcacaulis sp. ZE23SCel15]|uniref:hypothetical protein n=1 Tax=Asticcacaulis sp. ZE23SCel15 TaxID=3059027 RepID=UPI00265D7122|nr:hypothetical protein [Asticcacaulis sp. ZE23SCel15]WKL58775.1 hypothetical protein Q1W73_07250 [Asticcacaulis sp. ZE23SCel15]
MKKLSNVAYWPLKLMVGLPLTVFAIATVVQLPKVWSLLGGDPYRLGLAVLQGGLPLLPFCLYAMAIWFAADMVARIIPGQPLEPILIKGLKRSGLWLGAGSIALYVRSSAWAWHTIYGNHGSQPLGTANYTLFAMVTLLVGLILYNLSAQIHYIHAQRDALKTELDSFI